jgi:hypothetical protein
MNLDSGRNSSTHNPGHYSQKQTDIITVQDSKRQDEDETRLWDKMCKSNNPFKMLEIIATLQLTILMATNSYIYCCISCS